MRRYVLVLGLLIAGSASAQAATLNHHDTSYHVEAPRPSIHYNDVASHNDRWDPWGHSGTYYGPTVGGIF
jgi:hypothetical protein